MMITTFPTRWFPLATGACAGLLCLSLCRLGSTTEIDSPANVNATSNPFVALKQSSPTYEWALEGNQVQFSIHDLTTGNFPLQINAGAISNSIRIGDDRNVGFGISTPQRNLHVVDIDDPPTLRLESSFQIWDIEADNLGFDLVSNPAGANTRPFTVLPNAPTASLFVATNGSVGIGTSAPNNTGAVAGTGKFLNVRADGGTVATGVCNGVFQGTFGAQNHLVHLNAAANQRIMRLQTSSGFTGFHVLNDSLASYAVANVISMKMSNGNVGLRVQNPAHPLHLASGAHVTAGGVFTNASSRELKRDIAPITSNQALETVRALQPVGFRYNNEPEENYIGFIAEDVPELVATKDRKSLAPMDVVAVLTKVVQDQDRQLDEQRAINRALMERLTKLEGKLAQ